MARINEDIRFYLPADPYYYQVDNLPLKDLLDNDIALQEQIDNLSLDDTGAVFRNGIKELQPFIDAALPGQVSVRPGNFIGRTNRTNGTASERAAGSLGNAQAKRVDNGTTEIRTPPTKDGDFIGNFGDYNIANPIPAAERNEPAQGMARTSVFNFHGGSISIEGFDNNEFATAINDTTYNTTAPLARLDLIGITTINGAMDDPFLWGNVDINSPVVSVDGHPRLAVVKGAGIVQSSDSHKRDISVTNADKGRRYITIGTAAENLNEYGRDLDGNIILGPKFGTIPMPDDVVNVLFSKTEVDESMFDFAEKNLNGSFFLPLAYVYVPQTHVAGAPIPRNYLKDIRPLFRTAELTLAERQAVAASFQPSLSNPLTTVTHADHLIEPTRTKANQNEVDIASLEDTLRNTKVREKHYFLESLITNLDNVRGTRNWMRVGPANMGFPAGLPANTVAVQINFRGYISTPDTGDVTAHIRVAEYNPNQGTEANKFRGIVLVGRASGKDDNVGVTNTVEVPVDETGAFYINIEEPGFNNGVYCSIQGYTTETPIL
jgi:hypothetical protein